ncbi:hypothetical protein SAMN06265222_11194 [Neorhodopirellula lusitana]|uniref:Rhamnogalacturonan lyase domain-containing protein n=1 Tax=Neorhodopirellula lusitana TaxID=445327 RepID=A0ABY1QDV6_9BACT|nr:hypothetical protein SAMN06265222_11194 [Neorhodopirellula lusitana]
MDGQPSNATDGHDGRLLWMDNARSGILLNTVPTGEYVLTGEHSAGGHPLACRYGYLTGFQSHNRPINLANATSLVLTTVSSLVKDVSRSGNVVL